MFYPQDARSIGAVDLEGQEFQCQTGMVKRESAVKLAEHILRNLDADRDQWPLGLVTEVYVFGSFARGALASHDLDVDIEYVPSDRRWGVHVAQSLAYGRDPHAPMRRVLTAGRRGCQMVFDFRRQADFELTVLWRRGDGLAVALERLHAIEPDQSAGRAPRDAVLPQFEGIDEWVPRPYREVLCGAVDAGAVALERVLLDDAQVQSAIAVEHLNDRWKSSSPLYGAAAAVVACWERQGVDPGQGHLHGADIRDKETPYFAGFGWRYFNSIPACLTEFGGVEWIEVVRPTRTRPLDSCGVVGGDGAVAQAGQRASLIAGAGDGAGQFQGPAGDRSRLARGHLRAGAVSLPD